MTKIRLELIVFTLILSVTANFFLCWKVIECRRNEACLRMTPLGIPQHEDQMLKKFSTAKLKVIFIGDSRIARWLKLPLNDRPDIGLLNQGVGGQTTSQVKLRIDRDAKSLNPDIVIIQVGINDLKSIGILPERKDWIKKTCLAELKAIVRELREVSIEVVLMTVLPRGDLEWLRRPTWSGEIDEAVSWLNTELRQLKDKGVTIVDATRAMTEGGIIRPEFSSDALHFSEQGYEMLNAIIRPQLEKLIQMKRTSAK